MVKPIVLILSIVTFFAVFSGCGTNEEKTLYVYCDVILKPAMDKIASKFERKSDYRVEMVFDPEDRVFRRMKLSNHADVYIAITPGLIQRAEKFELCRKQESICGIMPVMITSSLNPLRIKTLKDLEDADRRLGINDVETTLGQVTKELFEKNGVPWDEVREKIHYPSNNEEKLIETLQSSAIDVGFVWSMTSLGIPRIECVQIEPSMNVYLPVVAMSLKKSKHPEAADDFVDFLKTPQIEKVWRKFGCEECANPDCTGQRAKPPETQGW